MSTPTHLWSITNRTSGHQFGLYRGTSRLDALDTMARDAGHADAIAMHADAIAMHAAGKPYELRNIYTDETIRNATAAEHEASLRAPGGTGAITVDGQTCYVDCPPLDHDLSIQQIDVYVLLRSDGMGDATENDFLGWFAYVRDRLDDELGFVARVEADSFGAGGGDTVTTSFRGDDTDTIDAVRDALRSLWESWCSEGWQAWRDVQGVLGAADLDAQIFALICRAGAASDVRTCAVGAVALGRTVTPEASALVGDPSQSEAREVCARLIVAERRASSGGTP